MVSRLEDNGPDRDDWGDFVYHGQDLRDLPDESK